MSGSFLKEKLFCWAYLFLCACATPTSVALKVWSEVIPKAAQCEPARRLGLWNIPIPHHFLPRGKGWLKVEVHHRPPVSTVLHYTV